MVEFRLAQAADVHQIEALYAEAGYGGSVGEEDIVLVAIADEEIVGVVRLCPENGTMVLRGMQIAETYQRQRVGSQLLTLAATHLNAGVSYCLPYSHLEKFYGAESFEPICAAELPEFLALRVSSYLARGQDVIAMRRPRPNPTFQPTPSARLN